MAVKKHNKRITNIIKNLSSKDEKEVSTAIKQVRKHGKKEAVVPLINLLCTTKNPEIKDEITAVLFDLKDQSVVEQLIFAIESDKYASEKAVLISIFWQSSLDSSQHISTFIKEAIKGDYYIGIEVLSVIDNYDQTFQETEVEDLKFDLDEAIEQETTEKSDLLVAIRSSLNDLKLEF